MSAGMKELVTELARELREQVLPHLGDHKGRTHVQSGAGGDVTFAIDEHAEAFMEAFLRERAPRVAFYSEDRGLVVPRRPDTAPAGQRPTQVLVVDPIDGTRPAMAGLEACCVSVAAAPLDPQARDAGSDGEPTMADVHSGCIVEIKSGACFIAERDRGLEMTDGDGNRRAPLLSDNDDLSRLFWTIGFRGRPARPLARVLGELIDTSSVGGAVFDLGSATFDMTRIVTGQLDAYMDVGSRMIEEVPALQQEFERVGGGAVLNNSPYDLAAAVLCLEEAGAVVTDAYGASLHPRPLLGSGHDYQMSCVASANERVHDALLAAIDRGMADLARTR